MERIKFDQRKPQGVNMAVLSPDAGFNRERMEMLNKYRGGLPFAQGGDRYTGGIAKLLSDATAYADRTGESPLKLDDMERMNEAAYLRRANLYDYDPSMFQLKGLDQGLADQITGGANDPIRQRQMALADLLYNQVQGNGPSVAGLQLQQGLEQQQAGLMSGLASGRPGMSSGALARALSRGYGDVAAKTNQQAALLRAQEQLSGQSALSQLLNQTRSGDIYGRDALLKAMLANQQANQALETQRGKDLLTLQQINPGAGVLERKQKPGKMSQAKAVAGIASGAASTIGGLADIYKKFSGPSTPTYDGPNAANGGDPYGNYQMGYGGRSVEF